MKKRLISILLLMTMLFTLLPAEAMAVMTDSVNTAVNTVQEEMKLDNPFNISSGASVDTPTLGDAVAWADTYGLFAAAQTDFVPMSEAPRVNIVAYLYHSEGGGH